LEVQFQLLDEESTGGMVWKDSTSSWMRNPPEEWFGRTVPAPGRGIHRRNGLEGQYQLLDGESTGGMVWNDQFLYEESTGGMVCDYQLLDEESAGGMVWNYQLLDEESTGGMVWNYQVLDEEYEGGMVGITSSFMRDLLEECVFRPELQFHGHLFQDQQDQNPPNGNTSKSMNSYGALPGMPNCFKVKSTQTSLILEANLVRAYYELQI
jgi:hypothetical protein